MSRVHPSLFAMLLGFSLLWSCGGDELDSISELNKYRILAIQAEPPSLGLGEQSVVRLFDFHPRDLNDSPGRRYRWRLCLLSAGAVARYECRVPEIELEGDGSSITVNPIMLLQTLDPETQALLRSASSPEAADAEDPLGGGLDQAFDFSDGIPVYLKVTAEALVEGGTEKLEAVKQLRLRFDAETPDNENPIFQGLSPTLPARLLPGAKVELAAKLTAESIERYTVEGETQEEELFLSWASSGGLFERSVTDLDPGKNILTLPDEPGPLKVYVVARDRRGGVGVAELDLDVIEEGGGE